MQRIAARSPPPTEVAQAFNIFFSQKAKTYEDFHIQIAESAYRYLREHPRPDGQPWLSESEITKIFETLVRPPDTGGKAHLAFGRLLQEELAKRRKEVVTGNNKEPKPKLLDLDENSELPLFLRVLSLYGASSEARAIAANTFQGPVNVNQPVKKIKAAISVWIYILDGFSREGNAVELLRTTEMLENISFPFVCTMQEILVSFFAERGDLEQAKHWIAQPVVRHKDLRTTEPSGNTYAAILKACALSGDLAFGHQVVASLLKKTPNKAAWDAIFVWSTAIGKGVDEVDRMMNVMVRRNDESRQQDPSFQVKHPDIDTINTLVEFCMSKQDPYSAERYIALGEKRGILPNAKTYTMQIQYRLSANDLDGARAAYFGLEGAKDAKSVEVTNQLIRALCDSKAHHVDDILAIVDDLLQNKARFDPETIAKLSVLHLRRGEVHDAIDILQVHAHHYSPSQRQTIREHLVEVVLDRQNSTADAWDTYQIVRQLFPETPRDIRIRIMNEFFARERSDMACHVFFHMRNHTHEAITATRDVYVAAFTGFARNADAESLELVHNQLKLDLNVDLDTKLRNSLMLAYAATGNNRRALEYWAEIAASKEGPTYNSIAIAFRSCEGMPWGDQHAKPIWQRLKQMDIDIDKQIFTAYVCAIARNQLHEEAAAMLETVEDEYGFKPDLYM